MRRLVATTFAVGLAFACSVSAFAMEVPIHSEVRNLNGVQEYVKTYTLSPEVDPQQLIEEPFVYEGYNYTFSSITKQENSRRDVQEHTETLTVNTDKKDLSVVLEALSPDYSYDDGRYIGTLKLDHTSIKTEPAGYQTKSYTVSETKEIGNLSSNDMSFIPATAIKNGKTLPLKSVDWQVQSTAVVDDILVPSQYKAVAVYSGNASYSAATGYVTTADYVGEISSDEIQDVTYTLTYVGAEVTPSGIIQTLMSHPGLMIGGGFMLLAIVILAGVLLRTYMEYTRLREQVAEDVEDDVENVEEEAAE